MVCAVKCVDGPYLTVSVLFGVSLISDLLWARREVRRLAVSEMAKKAATQFLWSCIFFSMLSFGLGMAVSCWNWFCTTPVQIRFFPKPKGTAKGAPLTL